MPKALTATLFGAALILAVPALAQPGPARGMTELFDRVDADRDGRATWNETWGYVQARFAEADRDRDGGLTTEEMSAMRPGGAEARPGRGSPEAEFGAAMFRGLDADRDQRVTLNELRPAIEARFRALDANGDNAVARDELPSRHADRPAR